MRVHPWGHRERQAAALLADDWLSSTEDSATPPSAVLEALQRAVAVATPHQLPVAVLGGGELGAALVVLRLCDFAAWFAPDGDSVVCSWAGALALHG